MRLTIRMPGLGDVVDERLRADDVRGAAVALAEQVLDRRADGHDLAQRGLEAEPPQLADELLGCVADVVGEEGDRLAGVAQRRDGLRRALERLVADPEAAVEVEQDLVVAGDPGGERHARCLSSPPMSRLGLLALLLACVLGVAACGGDDEAPRASRRHGADEPPSAGRDARAASRSRRRPRRTTPSSPKPKERLKAGGNYVATVVTSCGEFKIALDAKRAPRTGGSFKYLADKGFYDGLTFHRIVAGFVIQGGDPKGDGTGGPGYTVVEKPPGGLQYTKGVVAMAKGGNEPPGRLRQPVVRRDRRGRPAPAGLRAARQGHRGPGRRRQDRRRADHAGRAARGSGGHPVREGHRAVERQLRLGRERSRPRVHSTRACSSRLGAVIAPRANRGAAHPHLLPSAVDVRRRYSAPSSSSSTRLRAAPPP